MDQSRLNVITIGLENSTLDTVDTACRNRWQHSTLSNVSPDIEFGDLFRKTSPDVVILDLNSVEDDGLAVIECIKRHTDAPLIAISYATNSSRTIEALKAGADRFMLKPLHKKELVTHIDALVRPRIAFSFQGVKANSSTTARSSQQNIEKMPDPGKGSS